LAEIAPLAPVFVERVWGSLDLSPLYPPHASSDGAQPRPIGEVWFQTDPPLPLLIKFLFTTAPLSVQVHPNDEQARAAGLGNGKTEMWHILRADPGARIALGFERECGLDEVKQACLDGSVERLLHYEEPRAGDSYFTRANTVHALGAGLTVLEIQQHSDTTYRLYDYGRPRELHLDAGLAVSELGPWRPEGAPGPSRPEGAPGPVDAHWTRLACCEFFTTDLARLREPVAFDAGADFALVIFVGGHALLNGQPARAGEVFHVAGGTRVELAPQGECEVVRVFPSGAIG
jgi:mannose-6-phosphate isomerase class I